MAEIGVEAFQALPPVEQPAAHGRQRALALAFEEEPHQQVVHLPPGLDARHDLLTRVAALGERDRPIREARLGGQHVLVELGYEQPPRDSMYEFHFRGDYVDYLAGLELSDDPISRVKQSQPTVIVFGYREGPRALDLVSGG